jgi:bifunctional enzyme CysN/CysC
MPWYEGPTLLHHLEHVNVGAGQNFVDFRYPVQYVLRPNQDFRGYAGQIASGRIRPGEEVVVFPSGLESKIKAVVTSDGDLEEAVAGDSVVLTLTDEIDISRGDMIVRKGNLPQRSNEIDATICWMSDEPFDAGKMYQLRHNTRLVRAMVSQLNYRIDVDTMHRETVESLRLNEIGRVQLTTTKPLFYDRYALNRSTGNFVLIDPVSNNTVAAGMIRGRSQDVDDLLDVTADEKESRRQRSENVVWEAGALTLTERETLNKHKGAVLWFTGLSGSGKSTIAKALERKLFERGIHTMFLDGDNLRHGLNGDLGFAPEDRAENIRRVSEVAALGFSHASVVLCSFISPYLRDRDFARTIVPEGRFFEIYAKCDIEILKRRDPKGLYAKALAGEIKSFTGISAPYEEPENAELVVETDVESVEESVEKVILMMKNAGIF